MFADFPVRGTLKRYAIHDLAKRLNVSVKTVKNWETKGKIPKPRRNQFGWREYSPDEIRQIEEHVKRNHYFVKSNMKPAASD